MGFIWRLHHNHFGCFCLLVVGDDSIARQSYPTLYWKKIKIDTFIKKVEVMSLFGRFNHLI